MGWQVREVMDTIVVNDGERPAVQYRFGASVDLLVAFDPAAIEHLKVSNERTIVKAHTSSLAPRVEMKSPLYQFWLRRSLSYLLSVDWCLL